MWNLLLPVVGTVIDKLFPDAEAREKAKYELAKMQMDGELKVMETQLSAIIAEAQSADPWTSRARPSFLYLFYLVVVMLVIVAPAFGVFFPNQMARFYINVSAGFTAIPDALWATFTTGYLGYVAARQYGKTKGTDK